MGVAWVGEKDVVQSQNESDYYHTYQQGKTPYKKVSLMLLPETVHRLANIMHGLQKLLLFHLLACLGKNCKSLLSISTHLLGH